MSWAQIVSSPPPEKPAAVAAPDSCKTHRVSDNGADRWKSSSQPIVPPRMSCPKRGGGSSRDSDGNGRRGGARDSWNPRPRGGNEYLKDEGDEEGFPRRGGFSREGGRSRGRGGDGSFVHFSSSRGSSSFRGEGSKIPRGGRTNSLASSQMSTLFLRPDQNAKLTTYVRYKASDSRTAREESGSSADWLEAASSAYRLWEVEYDQLMSKGNVDQNPAGLAWIRANKSNALRIAHREPVCVVHALATDPSFLKATALCVASGSGFSKETYRRVGFRFDNDCVEAIVRECVYPSIASQDSFPDGEEMLAAISSVSESSLWPETNSRSADLETAAMLASELISKIPSVDEQELDLLEGDRSTAERSGSSHSTSHVTTSRLWSDIIDDLDEE